eukprot:21504_1
MSATTSGGFLLSGSKKSLRTVLMSPVFFGFCRIAARHRLCLLTSLYIASASLTGFSSLYSRGYSCTPIQSTARRRLSHLVSQLESLCVPGSWPLGSRKSVSAGAISGRWLVLSHSRRVGNKRICLCNSLFHFLLV